MTDEQKTLAAIAELYRMYREHCAMTGQELALLAALGQFRDTIERLAARSGSVISAPVNTGKQIVIESYLDGCKVVFGPSVAWWQIKQAIEQLNVNNEQWLSTNRWIVDADGLVGRSKLVPMLVAALRQVSSEVEVRP